MLSKHALCTLVAMGRGRGAARSPSEATGRDVVTPGVRRQRLWVPGGGCCGERDHVDAAPVHLGSVGRRPRPALAPSEEVSLPLLRASLQQHGTRHQQRQQRHHEAHQRVGGAPEGLHWVCNTPSNTPS
ncbi:Protein of unknown function [Gryllus bimaculatus]|nr:Protein of unknown function [Gryllus bimaculatus]